jgi:hypothetical protein
MCRYADMPTFDFPTCRWYRLTDLPNCRDAEMTMPRCRILPLLLPLIVALAGLFATPLLVGCAPSGASPDAPGTRPAPTGGVVSGSGPDRPSAVEQETSPAPAIPPTAPAEVLLVEVDLCSIEVPVGMASGSEDIWSYLNEQPLGAEQARACGLNGFRVGLGQADTWPDVARVLQDLTGRTLRKSRLLAPPGRPVPVVLKSGLPSVTLFAFRADRTLTGEDFPPGDAILNTSMTFDQGDPSEVWLTLQPQVRTARQRPRVVSDLAGPRVAVEPDFCPLTPLTVQVPVPRGGFLVIGPGSMARRPYSPGRHFLVAEKKGMHFETVLVLIPRVVRKQKLSPAPGERELLGGTSLGWQPSRAAEQSARSQANP